MTADPPGDATGSEPGEAWRASARRTAGADYARAYAARFDALAAAGRDVHGEAAFVARLVPPGSRVLDAGCGTGRVGERLAELGYAVTGVDVDEAMVAVARERAPQVPWLVGDLAALDLPDRFDVVVTAGNVVPFLPEGLLGRAVAGLAAHLVPGGLLVAGFGLTADHLPPGARLVTAAAYDAACAGAGLVRVERLGGWDRAAYVEGGGYLVAVDRRPDETPGDSGLM